VIEPGVYTGVGNRDIDFLGKAIIVRSVNSLDPCTVATTVIDCEGAGRGFYFRNEEGESSVLAGLTITGGYADYGGGIYCPDGEPTIRNCVITGNTAGDGGGICYGRPTITGCTISYNTATHGGGGVCGSDGQIINCTITGNTAGYSGGGVRQCYGPISGCLISNNAAGSIGGGVWACLELNNCIISGNWAGADGGGVEECGQLSSCIFVGNSAGQNGGGLSCCEFRTVITNCTFVSNTVESGLGGGIVASCFSAPVLTNTILWANSDSNGTGESSQLHGGTPEVFFSCIQDDDPYDTNIPFGGADNNNIDDYPMFVHDANDGGDGWGDDPCTPGIDEGANDDFGDLHLLSGSACINVGNPFSWIGPEGVDIDGQPRLMGGTIDIGADEFPYPRILVTKPAGGEVWVGESSHQITWLSEIYEGLVDILFSSNGGTDWDAVETGAENTGSYAWHLPEMESGNRWPEITTVWVAVRTTGRN
jgi:hypothetical protein